MFLVDDVLDLFLAFDGLLGQTLQGEEPSIGQVANQLDNTE